MSDKSKVRKEHVCKCTSSPECLWVSFTGLYLPWVKLRGWLQMQAQHSTALYSLQNSRSVFQCQAYSWLQWPEKTSEGKAWVTAWERSLSTPQERCTGMGWGGGRGWGVSRLWTVPMDPACTSQRWSQWEGIPSSFSPENPASYTAMDTVLIESQLNRIWGVTHFFLIS